MAAVGVADGAAAAALVGLLLAAAADIYIYIFC